MIIIPFIITKDGVREPAQPFPADAIEIRSDPTGYTVYQEGDKRPGPIDYGTPIVEVDDKIRIAQLEKTIAKLQDFSGAVQAVAVAQAKGQPVDPAQLAKLEAATPAPVDVQPIAEPPTPAPVDAQIA